MSCLIPCSLRNSASRSRVTSAFFLVVVASLARSIEFSPRKQGTRARRRPEEAEAGAEAERFATTALQRGRLVAVLMQSPSLTGSSIRYRKITRVRAIRSSIVPEAAASDPPS